MEILLFLHFDIHSFWGLLVYLNINLDIEYWKFYSKSYRYTTYTYIYKHIKFFQELINASILFETFWRFVEPGFHNKEQTLETSKSDHLITFQTISVLNYILRDTRKSKVAVHLSKPTCDLTTLLFSSLHYPRTQKKSFLQKLHFLHC